MNNEGLSEGIRIVLKFSKGTKIFLKEGKFVSAGEDISCINDCLNREPDIDVYPLFDLSPEINHESPPGGQFSDLSRYYVIVVKDTDTAERLRHELNRMSFVEEDYIKPPALPAIFDKPAEILSDEAPPATSDFSSLQEYLNTAPAGVDARYAWTLTGGKGDKVQVIDIHLPCFLLCSVLKFIKTRHRRPSISSPRGFAFSAHSLPTGKHYSH